MEGPEPEDMLFSFPSSQNSFDSVNEDGDLLDELSNERDDSEFDDLWEAETSQEVLLGPASDEIIDEDVLDEFENAVLPNGALKNITNATAKDRY